MKLHCKANKMQNNKAEMCNKTREQKQDQAGAKIKKITTKRRASKALKHKERVHKSISFNLLYYYKKITFE